MRGRSFGDRCSIWFFGSAEIFFHPTLRSDLYSVVDVVVSIRYGGGSTGEGGRCNRQRLRSTIRTISPYGSNVRRSRTESRDRVTRHRSYTRVGARIARRWSGTGVGDNNICSCCDRRGGEGEGGGRLFSLYAAKRKSICLIVRPSIYG